MRSKMPLNSLVVLFALTSLLRVRCFSVALLLDPFGTRNLCPDGALDGLFGGGKDTVLRSDMFRGLFAILNGSVALERLA